MIDIDGLQVVSVHAIPTREFKEERITGLLLPETRHTSASVGFVPPYGLQTPHYQDRPQRGDEIIFVYEGTFRVLSGGKRTDIFNTDKHGPVYILVRSGTPASLENCGPEMVRFFSVFSPPFAPGETHFLEEPVN